MVKFWKGTREQSENFEGNTGTRTPPPPLGDPHCLQSCSFEVLRNEMDLFPNEQNFDLDKSKQTFHHSLKEHHKISNIPAKFRCEML